MEVDTSHPWSHRIRATDESEYDHFVGKWLHDLSEQDLSNPAMSITNGWMAKHMENKWYADTMRDKMTMFAYDSRGQGESIKQGELDAIQGAIDANYVIGQAFSKFDQLAEERGVEPGNKILQGNCIGAMTVAALYAGRFNIAQQSAGALLISPVSTFDLPLVVKTAYFFPPFVGKWAIKYLGEPVAKMMVSGEDSEFSRQKALERLNSIDIDAALKQAKQIFWRENVEKLWKYIDVPTLMLVSDSDPLTKLEQSAEVYHALKYPIWLQLKAPDHLLLEGNIDYLSDLIPKFAADPWSVYEDFKDITPEFH